MPVLSFIKCVSCKSIEIKKNGFDNCENQRYICQNIKCPMKSFKIEYKNKGCQFGIKNKIIDMAINASGIRDTSRVLGIDKNTVINTLKGQEDIIVHVNKEFLSHNVTGDLEVSVGKSIDAEVDEQWSFVQKKSNQRWLWYAIDHKTNTILAYVFGKRKDKVFKKLQKLLKQFNIKKYYTDNWGAYNRHIDSQKHQVGKANTQKIERKNLNFRTWIKRLTRKTICFSKIEKMHDIVIGLLINKTEFGLNIYC
jgi:IS1 family transposase/transposase-like protein